jgi:hypothetical protein
MGKKKTGKGKNLKQNPIFDDGTSDEDIMSNPLHSSSDEDEPAVSAVVKAVAAPVDGAVKAAAKAAKASAKVAAKAAKQETNAARQVAMQKAKDKAAEAKSNEVSIDPVLQAMLNLVRCMFIAVGMFAGIVSALLFAIAVLVWSSGATSTEASSSVEITPKGNLASDPLKWGDPAMRACSEARFLVAGSGRWCGEVGGSSVDEDCVPDEPMQWQLNRETWACVDYDFSNPEFSNPENGDDEAPPLSMYCLMTTAVSAQLTQQ